jgi:N-acyl-D-aspartate/D-glutamate deacylase
MMQHKGRLKVGADADIVVFNPDTILDRGTFEDPVQPPDGVKYVLVNGTVTVDDARLADGAAAGQAVRAPLRP